MRTIIATLSAIRKNYPFGIPVDFSKSDLIISQNNVVADAHDASTKGSTIKLMLLISHPEDLTQETEELLLAAITKGLKWSLDEVHWTTNVDENEALQEKATYCISLGKPDKRAQFEAPRLRDIYSDSSQKRIFWELLKSLVM